jgi:hypothetical protein
MDVVLGIYTTPKNIFLVLIGFCLVLILFWLARRFYITYAVTEKISGQIKKIGDRCIRYGKSLLKSVIKRRKKQVDKTSDFLDEED